MSNKIVKAYVSNTVRVDVRVNDSIVYSFSAHPNLLVLPQIGQSYLIRERHHNDGLSSDGLSSDGYAEFGKVVAVTVDHRISTVEGGESSNLSQRIYIDVAPSK